MRRNIDYRRLKGVRRYACILRCLADAPRTNAELVAIFGGSVSRIGECMRGLSHLGLVHVTGWRTETRPCDSARRSCATLHQRVYGIGPGQDAPRPTGVEYRRVPTRPNSELIAFAALVRELREPSTMRDLMEQCGLARAVATAQIAWMRSIGLVRIAAWQRSSLLRTGGQPVPLYAIGVGKSDAARPKAMTPEQRRARQRQLRQQRAQHKTLDIFSRALAANSSAFTIAQWA